MKSEERGISELEDCQAKLSVDTFTVIGDSLRAKKIARRKAWVVRPCIL